jgi:predicted nucleic-acid-binding protein
MIGLDTKVLIRHLTQDDPVQSPQATHLFERTLTEEAPGFVNIVVIVETAWVLERAYALPSVEIAAAIERILQTAVLIVEHEADVFTAMIAVKENRASFADALIGALDATAGCAATVTLDRKAARLRDFQLL